MLIVGLEGTGFLFSLLRSKAVANIRKEQGSERPSFRTHSHELFPYNEEILHLHRAVFAPDSSLFKITTNQDYTGCSKRKG